MDSHKWNFVMIAQVDQHTKLLIIIFFECLILCLYTYIHVKTDRYTGRQTHTHACTQIVRHMLTNRDTRTHTLIYVPFFFWRKRTMLTFTYDFEFVFCKCLSCFALTVWRKTKCTYILEL